MAASFTAEAAFIPLAIQKFKQKYSGIELHFRIDRSALLEKALLDGALDVAILSRAPEFSQLIGIPYVEEKIVVTAPPNHPLVKMSSVPLEVLAKEPFVVSKDGSRNRKALMEAFAKKGLTFKIALEVDVMSGSRDAFKTAAASGIGLAVNHMCHVAGDIKLGRLKILKIPELNLIRHNYIAIHKRREKSSLVQTFIDFLKKNTKSN